MADHGRVRAARSVTNLAPYPPNQPDPFELTLSAPRPTRWTATEGIGSSPPVCGVASRSTAEKRSKVVRSCQGCRPGFLRMCGDCPDHIPALGVATTNSPSHPPRAINADSFVARSAVPVRRVVDQVTLRGRGAFAGGDNQGICSSRSPGDRLVRTIVAPRLSRLWLWWRYCRFCGSSYRILPRGCPSTKREEF